MVANNAIGFGTSPSWSKRISGGSVVPFNVTTTGVHTINIWMREDGLMLDKLVLTRSTSYTPTGAGPAQSAKN